MSNNMKTIETPNLSHVTSLDWDNVYEPAEDTFLLLDSLEKDLDYIYANLPGTVLEVGCGSGIIVTALSKLLKSRSHFLAIDINQHACDLTKRTSLQNQCSVDVIQGNLTHSLKSGTIDMVVFNPPYVVTPSSEVHGKDILTRSWAGGKNGMEVTDKFLNQVIRLLAHNGFGYLVALKENQPEEIMMRLRNQQFICDILDNRRIRGEELFVLKFIKKHH